MQTKNILIFLAGIIFFQHILVADNELDVRLDQQDLPFQEELKRAQDKLEQEKLKNRQFLSELRLLAAGDESYAKELSGMVALAMQPLSELAEEDTVKLAAVGAISTSAGNANDFKGYGWQTLASLQSNTWNITFDARASCDLIIGFQCPEGILEFDVGANNNSNTIINWYNSSSPGNSITLAAIAGARMTKPNVTASYTLIATKTSVSLSCGGVPIFTYALPPQTYGSYAYTAYSFRGVSWGWLSVSNVKVISLSSSWTSIFNGITKTSTISQSDADAQAKAAWTTVETSTITPVVTAYNSAQSTYQTELNNAKRMCNELIDLFKADPVSTYSVAAWAKV